VWIGLNGLAGQPGQSEPDSATHITNLTFH